MTVSELDRNEWLEKLAQLVARDSRMSESTSESFESRLSRVLGRPEWYAIGSFGENTGTSSVLYDAMHLFWGVYEIWKDGGMYCGSVPPEEYEDLFLDWFEHLYHSHRVPYIPDVDDIDNHDELFTYLHIAAARAFRIRKGNEISEEVLDCLREVERTMKRLQSMGGGPDSFFGEAPSFYTSTGAIVAMVFVELWRIRQAEGRYADALHYLSSAARYYDGAATNFYGEDIDELWPDFAKEEHYWESQLQRLLTGLNVSARETIETFQTIKSQTGLVDDWTQVARDCRAIADSSIRIWDFVELRDNDDDRMVVVSTADSATGFDQVRDELVALNAEITDDHRGMVTWSEFWHGAKVWASAQLSPSEYRKMRDDDEKHASETCLKNYFSQSDWSSLPEPARQRLINADLIWNSPECVRRESILNELLRATEVMCERFIFQPLMNEERTKSHILSIEAKVAEDWRRSSLGVREYIDICELPSLPDSLAERKLTDSEIKFLTDNLPVALRQLAEARNPAEHETGTTVPRALVDSFFRGFLGIGQLGILPELARIGRKLGRRPRR